MGHSLEGNTQGHENPVGGTLWEPARGLVATTIQHQMNSLIKGESLSIQNKQWWTAFTFKLN